MKILVCRETQTDGSVLFIVYDTDEKKCLKYDNAELTLLVAARKIYNAKLENSVIKMTDGRRMITLSAEESKTVQVFYIFETYTSPNDQKMFAAVSNHGITAEFSESIAEEFFKSHKVVNATLTKKGVHLTKVPTFSSPLQKSLEHINIH